jgi:UDP-N-acetylmuramoylalanine--D-glutamate ligase
VFVGGNLGKPLSNAVGGGYDWCVVEVSSFQLEFVQTFHPRVAAILNLTSDHMDRHGDMDAYAAAKLRIFGRMEQDDRAILCRDQTWWRSKLGSPRAALSTFGRSPLGPGERGMVCDSSERVVRAHDGWCVHLGEGWPTATFAGLEHRLQYVATHAGVEYWNDSKATNPGATARTLEAFDEPVILMIGGVGKGADFSELATMTKRLRRMVVYGEAADAIERACGSDVAAIRARDFRSAFAVARQAARPGDIVLLAPACASFDEFDNYAHRGRVFVELVEGLGR